MHLEFAPLNPGIEIPSTSNQLITEYLNHIKVLTLAWRQTDLIDCNQILMNYRSDLFRYSNQIQTSF